jgi:hypothetical protein
MSLCCLILAQFPPVFTKTPPLPGYDSILKIFVLSGIFCNNIEFPDLTATCSPASTMSPITISAEASIAENSFNLG